MLHLIGQSRGDYFNIECSDCERAVTTSPVDADGAVPRMEFRCSNCGKSAVLKLAPLSWPWLIEGR